MGEVQHRVAFFAAIVAIKLMYIRPKKALKANIELASNLLHGQGFSRILIKAWAAAKCDFPWLRVV
jgi:hypothetical protein